MTEWWSTHTGVFVGAIGGGGLGALAGCFGGLIGWLAPRGIARGPILIVHALFVAVGAVSLVAGITAVIMGQPYHVWYPLTLIGGVLTCVMGSLLPVVLVRYRQAEHRRLEAEELRRG
jgi:hypothetical protein